MISNERRWPSQRQPEPRPYYTRPERMPMRPPVREDMLITRDIQVERKQFIAMLKENPRGRFLRIIESASGRSNSIVIPATGLREFKKLLEEMLAAAEEIPMQNHASAPETDEPNGNRF